MKANIEGKMRLLSEAQSVVPPTFVWENIEEVLHPKPIRRVGLWIVLGVVALALTTILLGYFSQVNQNSQNIEFIATNNSSQDNITSILNSENTIESPIVLEKNNIGGAEDNQAKIKAQLPIQQSFKKSATTLIPADSDDLNAFSEDVYIYIETPTVDKNNISEKDKINTNAIPSDQNRTTQQIEQLSKISNLRFTGLVRDDGKPYYIKDDIICPSFNGRKKMSPFVTVGLLGGIHTKSLPNGDNALLAAQRDQTESSWYTWGVYGSVGLNFTPQFYAGVGIDWTQSKDKFHDESETITKMVITFDPNTGQPTDTSFITGKFINKGEIRYNSLDIPVFIGLHKQLNTWDLGVELGGLINVKFAANGKIMNESLMVSRIEDEPVAYKTNLGLGIKASLVVRKNFGNGFSLELKPTFKTYLSSINDPSYPIPMKMNVFGLNVGLRKDFQTKSFVIK